MHRGAIIASGTPDAIKNNELVQNTYLGERL
jgi:ABC-type branched-subunit amino acid transport system ATPase component